MFEWLNATALTMLGEPASWAELLGFATGLACVWLVVRQHVANWPIGIVNVLLLMVAFWTGGLYADANLQIVYVVLGFYGWWEWAKGRGGGPARRTRKAEWIALAIGGLAATAAMWRLLDVFTDSKVPLADAVTTALSLVATYGQCRKLVESWWFWIVADIIYVPLYLYKHLNLTAVLYLVFLGLSILGLRTWLLDIRQLGAAPTAAVICDSEAAPA